jgi:hypothetical protein
LNPPIKKSGTFLGAEAGPEAGNFGFSGLNILKVTMPNPIRPTKANLRFIPSDVNLHPTPDYHPVTDAGRK